MSSLLRFVQLLTMVFWVGGLLFFAFMLAPTAFHVLPIRQAGLVVGSVLRIFHPAGLVCGSIFLAVTFVLRDVPANTRRRIAQLLLAGLMMLLTAYLQLSVLPAMERDQRQVGGDINAVAIENLARLDFDRRHVQSERVESVVLFCGLAVVFLLARGPAVTKVG